MKRGQLDLGIILAGRVLQAASSIISIRLSTTLLGPAEIGRVNLILGVTSAFGLLMISPIGNYVARQALEWNLEGRLIRILRQYATFLVAVAGAEAIGLLAVHLTVGIGTDIGLGWLIWLVAGSLLLGALNGEFISLLNTLGYRGWFVVLANLTTWIGLVAALGLSLQFGARAEHWLTGLLVGQTVVLIASWNVLLRVARRPTPQVGSAAKTDGFEVRSVVSFALPLVIGTGFYWIQTTGYRFAVVDLADVRTLGLLTTGLAIALTPLATFDTFFTEYYRPIFYQDIVYGDNQQKAIAWSRYASAYLPAVLLVGAFVAFSGSFLARLLVSQVFQEVAWLAFWGALMQVALIIFSLYASFAFATMETRVLVRPHVIGAVITISVILLLTHLQPLLDTAVALTLGMIVTMTDVAITLGHAFPLRIPWRRLGMAGILAAPMIAGFERAAALWLAPTEWQALAVLVVGGAYMLVAQYLMARTWLFHGAAARRESDLVADVSIELT